jgi:ribosomal RNA-processing protein 8
VHSFDLESDAPGVVACNMADVPLDNCSVEIAVFSLSLMGTDYGKFMEEAHRVRLRNLFLFLFTPGPGPVACR